MLVLPDITHIETAVAAGDSEEIVDLFRQQQAVCDKLREVDERLRLFIEHAPAAIAMFDKDMRYLAISRRWLTDYGLGERNIIGLSHYEVFPEIPQRWKDIHARALAGVVERAEEDPFPRADGHTDWVRWEIHPWRKAGGEIGGIIMFTEVITERHMAQEALREERDRAQRYLDIAGVIFVAIDSEGRVTLLNRRGSEVLGYEVEELMGKDWFANVLPERDRDRVRALFLKLIRGEIEAVSTFENTVLTRSGEERLIEWSNTVLYDESGKIIGTLSSGEDITDRKRAEEALRASEARLRIATKATHLGIFDYNITSGKIQWDARVKELWGVWQDEPITYDVFMAGLHPDDRELTQAAVNRSLDPKGSGEFSAEYRVINRRDGIERWIAASGRVFFENDRPVRLVGAVQDVTEIKTAVKSISEYAGNLRRQTAELLVSNKELEAFSYSVSHTMRAPLRSIDGYSHALLEEYSEKLDEQGRDYLGRIRASAQRMGQLIEDILILSRVTRESMHFADINLSIMARAVSENLRKSEPERTVEAIIPEGITVKGDEKLLHLVLYHLLGNAWKFTAHQQAARIEFGSMREDVRTVYFVRDNGIGIDMKYSANLFTPFFRLHTDDVFPGTGIGLSIVKRIIERHGGEIRAEGEPGKGATFYFTLGE